MRTLFLMRHGEAAQKAGGGCDHDRELAAVGRSGALRIGARIAEATVAPTLLLCSSALRAVETLEAIRPALPAAAEVEFDRRLYLADSDQLIERIQTIGAQHHGALVVGHNPGIGWLAHSLLRPESDPSGPALKIRSSFPAGALAVLTFDVDCWSSVAPQRGTLAGFTTPVELAANE
jgi:phosphohistidine phosphatase